MHPGLVGLIVWLCFLVENYVLVFFLSSFFFNAHLFSFILLRSIEYELLTSKNNKTKDAHRRATKSKAEGIPKYSI